MTATASRLGVASVLVGLALGASACGDSSDTPKQNPKAAAPAGAKPADLLMRAGEEPGFRPGALPDAMPRTLETITGVEAFAREMGMPASDIRRLRSEGFLSFTVGPIRGPRNTAGLSNVALYATAAGAKHSMAYDLRPEVVRAGGPLKGLRFFTVPGVPGARGWMATEPNVVNASWVQGRCYFTLGNQGTGPLTGPVAAGVRAMYQRTKGQCDESGAAGAMASPVAWSAPKDPLQRTLAAGLKPEVKEHLKYHVHAHLDVFVDGKPIVVPAGIGINVRDREVHAEKLPDGTTAYGGIQQCRQPCISPLHTHDATGIIHTESATTTPNTLGQFFAEWGQPLGKTVLVYVDGKRSTVDPASIELTDHREIAIVIGTPPKVIPKTADFSQA